MPEGSARSPRGEATRARLIETTVELLVDVGYAETTTEAVRRRAGVSRGALLHHFPSRADLVVAAIAHIAAEQAAALRAAAATLDEDGDRVSAALAVLLRTHSGPLFLAGLELWLAARTDPALHAVLLRHERGVGRELRRVLRALFGPAAGASAPLDAACELTLVALRGHALTSILRTDADRDARPPAGLEAALRALLSGDGPPNSQG
ncbi:TetR/AcrR family transcriptional regulator [Patulibacter sp. SYSU D01012]|uniref:TetR/AcrR family transcriptional regulator n=1 Tax=Patulibacter sp. SYSU D01012 TaxID=2817381 RepID=UPI001B310AFD|nr:TetR/AcrR family transcriptional regulator [Patulibacter sp. SYSU D01012]